ncbi:MAG: orotidine-5'-phosphate decarboxylase [Bacilli bacterium]|jgi:orotidine 5''-phosphate decarboxylase, subfamily 1
MVIVALDFENYQKVEEFLNPFETPIYVKVGMELFYQEGIEVIKAIKAKGHKVFLDLKLHDIPNTVYHASKCLANLDVDIINCHAAGGIQMMKACLEGVMEVSAQKNLAKRPLVIAVTQLTSTSKQMMNQELGINGEVVDTVVQYAQNAKIAGLDGVVCSPLEAQKVKEVCGQDFITVTPGIRPTSTQANDQVRITTPQMAKKMGCDFIVVGRPITKAQNPKEAYMNIKKEFLGE